MLRFKPKYNETTTTTTTTTTITKTKIYGKLRNQKWGFTNRDKRVPDTLPLLKKLFQIGLSRTHLLHVSIVIKNKNKNLKKKY